MFLRSCHGSFGYISKAVVPIFPGSPQSPWISRDLGPSTVRLLRRDHCQSRPPLPLLEIWELLSLRIYACSSVPPSYRGRGEYCRKNCFCSHATGNMNLSPTPGTEHRRHTEARPPTILTRNQAQTPLQNLQEPDAVERVDPRQRMVLRPRLPVQDPLFPDRADSLEIGPPAWRRCGQPSGAPPAEKAGGVLQRS